MSSLAGLIFAVGGAGLTAIEAPSTQPSSVLAAVPTGQAPSQNSSDAQPVRISGADRYATSATMASSWTAGVPTVFVVGGTGFADALSAAARAGAEESPLLLTRSGSLPPETVVELERLRPDRIVVVGGTSAVSDEVVDTLRGHAVSGQVERVWGTDRYTTSVAVSRLYSEGADVAYLASGEDFPDALGGAALAGHHKAPLLLTSQGQLAPDTRLELARLAPQQIVVLGGPAAVSDDILESATRLSQAPARRIAGVNRYATAAAVAQEYPPGRSPAYLASGEAFPDALVGAAPAARDGVPLLLTPKDRVHPATAGALARQQPQQMYVLGGSTVMYPSTVHSLGDYLTGPSSAETFTPLSDSDEFEWTGALWSAKEAPSMGPGPNRWDPRGVELGDRGSLKLKVAQNTSGQWESAEVVRAGPTGYGTYTFSTSTSVLPPNDRSVLGMFSYQHLSPDEGHEEIDIEYSQWGKPGTGPGSISMHKPDPAFMREFQLDYTGPLTHSFVWAPGYVKWTIVRDDTGSVMHQREVFGGDVPRFIDARMRINLWLIDGVAADRQEPFEVTFSEARWTPLPPGFSVPAEPPSMAKTAALTDGFDDRLDTSRWPGTLQYGQPSVAQGRLSLPLGPGYHGVQSAIEHELSESSITVEQIRPPAVHSQSESEIAFVQDADNSVHVFTHGSHSGRFRIKTDGTDQDVDFSYDPGDDRWIRIRHDGSRLHLETSPEGTTWNQAVPPLTAPPWVSEAVGQVKLGGGNWQVEDPAGSVRFDNLNPVD
ncbi:MAG: cell wall-binding repeat-containing protein [Ornithinimicrobium sp.]